MNKNETLNTNEIRDLGKNKKIRNPLIKRIPKELIGDWRKYLVVSLFLILVIGFVSGMYVANGSMMNSIDESIDKYNLEYGHFELDEKASAKTIKAIETGTKADIHQYMLDEAKKELDDKFEDEFKKEFDPKFKEEFDKQFNAEFPAKFKSEFTASFDKTFKKQFDQEFESSFKSEFDKSFSALVLQGLIDQGLDEETANSSLDSAISQAKKDGTYTKAYDEAFAKAKKSNYSSAYKSAYKTAYNKAYQPAYDKAYKEAYSSAYATAYDEAYQEAYDEAYNEAWDEVQDEVEEEYQKIVDKYELNDTDAPDVPVTVYENFFVNADEDIDADGSADGSIRVFQETDYINQACLMDGALPASKNEIAIDRMHAKNAGIEIGDEISVGGTQYKVSGLLSYVNFSSLFEKNSDTMFDALKFDVAMVTDEGFARLDSAIHYNYAWEYTDTPKDESAEKTSSDYFLKALLTQAVVADKEIEEYLPRYANSAVNFAPDDMGSDMAMGGIALYIFTIIIAFIFAVTTSNTIQRESSAIGTLRASGYTKGELIRHYMSMPIIVTLLSAIIGNILGYTLFKNMVISMYYNSYSLPAYETIWNGDAFVRTTLIPIALMFVINLIITIRMMQIKPLQFLRHDLKMRKAKKAIKLPNIHFFGRFRLRIVLQNLPNFLILFVGIYFIAVMLAMAVGMPATLQYYQNNVKDMMFADYQYVLTDYKDEDDNIIKTDNDEAEKFEMMTLLMKTESLDEEVSVYGIVDDSKYVQIKNLADLAEDEVYISNSFAGKYELAVGDEVTLDAEYENDRHTFKVAGIYDSSMSIAVFMPIDNYRSEFDADKDEFTGFLSNSKITDLDDDNVATVITQKDITKIADQLDHSMGAYMTYFQYLCVILSAVLIYLLTKLIIEKNENPISMIKILGYRDTEIFRLYLFATTIMVLIADVLSVFLGVATMTSAWKIMLFSYSGWFEFTLDALDYFKIFAYIFAGYLIVLFFDFRRIKHIPLDKTLKDIE